MASFTEARLARLEVDIGDFVASGERTRGRDFSIYESDPVGFIRDVLGGSLYPKQVEIAESVRVHPQTSVRSCHAGGKDFLAGRLALWWVYARRGLVILTGPTATQVEEILMRKEVRAAFVAGALAGELHVRALRPGGSGEAGILAKTGAGVSSMTGFHDARVLFIITEAQDPDIEHAWDAAFACTTGEDDRILTLGNPTEGSGKLYRAHREDSGWHAIRIASEDIPNVQAGRTVVPGLLTREGVARFVREYGADSAVVASRVHGEFPEGGSVDSLIQRSWLEDAYTRHESSTGYARFPSPTAALDVARSVARDESVAAIAQGARVLNIHTWRSRDLVDTANRFLAIADRAWVDWYSAVTRKRIEAGSETLTNPEVLGEWVQTMTRASGLAAFGLYVDAPGIGGGVVDTIRARARPVTEYWGWCPARDEKRFGNLRAEAYWNFRSLLDGGTASLPRDPMLHEEALAMEYSLDSKGRIVMVGKEELRRVLGRSPDRLDAVVIALAASTGGIRAPTVQFGSISV